MLGERVVYPTCSQMTLDNSFLFWRTDQMKRACKGCLVIEDSSWQEVKALSVQWPWLYFLNQVYIRLLNLVNLAPCFVLSALLPSNVKAALSCAGEWTGSQLLPKWKTMERQQKIIFAPMLLIRRAWLSQPRGYTHGFIGKCHFYKEMNDRWKHLHSIHFS